MSVMFVVGVVADVVGAALIVEPSEVSVVVAEWLVVSLAQAAPSKATTKSKTLNLARTILCIAE